MRTTQNRRALAVSVLLCMSATAGATLAAPAGAADRSAWYSCSSPALGDFPMSVAWSFADSAPYGGLLDLTTTVTLPADVVQTLHQLGIASLEGDLGSTATLADVPIDVEALSSPTDVPASGEMDLSTRGQAYTYAARAVAQAGDTPELALAYADGADGADVSMSIADADSPDADPLDVSCELDVYQDVGLGPVRIYKAGTKIYASIDYDKASRKVVSTAVVSPFTTQAVPRGTVKMFLKRNGTRIDQQTVRLRVQGQRIVLNTSAPPHGHYELHVDYLGNRNFGASYGVFDSQL